MSFTLNVDTGSLDALLAGLGGAVDESVRPAAHAGALVIYRRARELAPVFNGPPRYVKVSKSGKRGGYWIRPGQLRDAIYRVYSQDNSGAGRATYHVSWNAKKAPHGHWAEFGNARQPPKSFIRRAYVEHGEVAAEAVASTLIEEMTKRIG